MSEFSVLLLLDIGMPMGKIYRVLLGSHRTWTVKIVQTECCFRNDESYLGNCILSGKSLNSVIRKYFLSFFTMTLYGGYLERFGGKTFIDLFVFILKSIRMDYTYLFLSHAVCN